VVTGGAGVLPGREAVLAAAGDHPYARLTTGGDGPVVGYHDEGVLAWTGPGPWGPLACAVGDPRPAARLFARLRDDDRLAGARWLHLPRITPAEAGEVLPVQASDDWDFRWSYRPPPAQPGEGRVVRLADADGPAVARLLDRAFPETTTRPGDPRVRAWYGIRLGGVVVAAGADRSRGGVGFLAGLAVDPALRGHGLGAALTAAMTRRMFASYDCVSLGVASEHPRTVALYQRLGFVETLARTSVRLPD
jgi:RimJ/RimL family protein N-acetyltransferase